MLSLCIILYPSIIWKWGVSLMLHFFPGERVHGMHWIWFYECLPPPPPPPSVLYCEVNTRIMSTMGASAACIMCFPDPSWWNICWGLLHSFPWCIRRFTAVQHGDSAECWLHKLYCCKPPEIHKIWVLSRSILQVHRGSAIKF